jgi:hypothetical protein
MQPRIRDQLRETLQDLSQGLNQILRQIEGRDYWWWHPLTGLLSLGLWIAVVVVLVAVVDFLGLRDWFLDQMQGPQRGIDY